MPPKTNTATAKAKTKTKAKPTYEKMDQIEHIHNRSDMYVGAANKQTEHNEYVVNVATKPENQADNPKITKKSTIKYSPALLRIFVEGLSFNKKW